MKYKLFAAAVLVVSPFLAMTAQNLVPAIPQDGPPPPVAVAPPLAPEPEAVPAQAQAPMPMSAPVASPAEFSAPMAGAGEPMLAPGRGLPGVEPAANAVTVQAAPGR